MLPKVKMINQLLAGVHVAAAAEAIALGIKAGADANVLYGSGYRARGRKKGNHSPPAERGGTHMFLMAAAAGHSREDDSAVIKIFPGVNLPRFQ